jgi:hypothetical protein
VHLGCWISPFCGLFSLGKHFETYELCFFNFQIFLSGHGKPRITETTDTESVDMAAQLYMLLWLPWHENHNI